MPSILIVLHPLPVVLQIANDLAQLFTSIVVVGLVGRQTDALLMRVKFIDHFGDSALPREGHPASVRCPRFVAASKAEQRRTVEVADRMHKIENRNVISKVLCVNGPITTEAIGNEGFARRLVESTSLCFAGHLLAELGRVFHARYQRAVDLLRFVWRLLSFLFRPLSTFASFGPTGIRARVFFGFRCLG